MTTWTGNIWFRVGTEPGSYENATQLRDSIYGGKLLGKFSDY
jgi:hypothetical protein